MPCLTISHGSPNQKDKFKQNDITKGKSWFRCCSMYHNNISVSLDDKFPCSYKLCQACASGGLFRFLSEDTFQQLPTTVPPSRI